MLTTIVSGGQTGADRAALDVAAELGLAAGGWCPRGRRAEDGPIPQSYPLKETQSANYKTRTRMNVADSDATLILTLGPPMGGTALTLRYAQDLGRPCLVVDLAGQVGAGAARRWLADHAIGLLNVAGPRESSAPGIRDKAARFLRSLLAG